MALIFVVHILLVQNLHKSWLKKLVAQNAVWPHSFHLSDPTQKVHQLKSSRIVVLTQAGKLLEKRHGS